MNEFKSDVTNVFTFFFRSFERPAATIVPHGDGLATSLVFLSSDGAGLLDA